MGTDRRFKLWSGSDRRPEMFHYNHSQATQAAGKVTC